MSNFGLSGLAESMGPRWGEIILKALLIKRITRKREARMLPSTTRSPHPSTKFISGSLHQTLICSTFPDDG
jgi:hypothetical protein